MTQKDHTSPPKRGTTQENREQVTGLTQTEKAVLTLVGKLYAAVGAAATAIVAPLSLAVTAGGVTVAPPLIVAIAQGGVMTGLAIAVVTLIVGVWLLRNVLQRRCERTE